MDSILIGRVYGAVSVGLYSRAAALITRPLEQLVYPLEAVFLPAFSRLLSQPGRYRVFFMEAYEAIALISFLYTGMCFALAHPLTLVVLGPKWEKAATIFAAFTFAALQFPLTSFAHWLLASQGRGRDSFRANLIISVVMATSFIAGLPFGAFGVAIAYSVFLSPNSDANSLLPSGTHWSGEHRGLVDRLSSLFASLVCRVSGYMAGTPSDTGRSADHGIIDCGSGRASCRSRLFFVYPPARRVVLNLLSTLRELKNPTVKTSDA